MSGDNYSLPIISTVTYCTIIRSASVSANALEFLYVFSRVNGTIAMHSPIIRMSSVIRIRLNFSSLQSRIKSCLGTCYNSNKKELSNKVL